LDAKLAQDLAEKSARVDRALEEFLRGDPAPPPNLAAAPPNLPPPVPNLHDALLYALGLDQADPAARGKRIRPALCLVACEALGGEAEAALPFAMAIELMHNFFLVHDDIEDGDRFRRGRPSVWARYGLAHGINVGDYLLTKVFAALLWRGEAVGGGRRGEPTLPLVRLLVSTLEFTHVGQAQDINARTRRDFSVDDYLEMARNKTGYYLAAPMVGGAMIAGASAPVLDALRAFGQAVGPVFQIVDDIIDLTHGKGREETGCDIREGKRSFLVAHTASAASPAEREELFRALDRPREETTSDDVRRVAELFAKYGAVEAGRERCRALMRQAREALAPAPERLRETLTAIFDDLLDRRK
jgi:geranylgeranyl pyrophosphate synthase